ncbi:13851_t:CDS:2 [Ambispora leptoticha]|uniref:13851_t:CDS:1 n=1 Tax=Ambispora leptoticha TaxID=144679 RepID=A0A9N8VB34_9GLOM|nr:13851_t:CDS:2 [Ambispora leptoticha]
MTTYYFDFYNYEEDLTTLTFAVFCEFKVAKQSNLKTEFASLPWIFQNVAAIKPPIDLPTTAASAGANTTKNRDKDKVTLPPKSTSPDANTTNNEDKDKASKPEITLPPKSNKNENTRLPVSNQPESNNPDSDLTKTAITLPKSNPPGSEEIDPNLTHIPISNPPDSTSPDLKSSIKIAISEPANPSVPTIKELENPKIVISNPPEITTIATKDADSYEPKIVPIAPIGKPTVSFNMKLNIFIRDYYDETGVGVVHSMQMLETNRGDIWDIIFKDSVQQFRKYNKRTIVPDNILIRNMSRSDAKIGIGIDRKPVSIIKRYVTEKGEVKSNLPNGAEIQIKTPPVFKAAVFRDSFDPTKAKEIDPSKILAFKIVEFVGINNHATFGVSGSLKKNALVPSIQYSRSK